MEADFTSEYNGLDLRDLWRRGSGLTARRAIALIIELPEGSRTKKHIAGDRALFDVKAHLLADIRDLLNATQYFAGATATKDLKKSHIEKLARGMPQRIRRPGEPDPEKKFATPEELRQLFPPQKALARRRRKGL